MSGKIEISRELARLLHQDTISCWGVGGNAANQLRAILAAPVAERQEPVAWIKPKTLEALTPSGMVYVTGFDLGDSIPLYTSSAAPVVERQPVAWSYCPECGCEDLHHEQAEHKQCANCYQEWFSDIDYSEVVRGNLEKLKASPPAPVSADIAHDRAYRNGMMAGFSFGIRGDEDGYAKAVERYDVEIHDAKAEQPAPIAVADAICIKEVDEQFEAWWESDGQYCRAGGGSYEKTFAYRAYEAATARANEHFACLDKVKELNQ